MLRPLLALAWLHAVVMALTAITTAAAAASSSSFKPSIKASKIGHAPQLLHYFDDSSVILYLDSTGALYRSADDGASWQQNKKLGTVVNVVMHPFHIERSYAVLEPTKKGDKKSTIAYTTNRGESWDKYVAQGPVAPNSLHFHKSLPDHILFQTSECSDSGCDDKVWYTRDSFGSVALVDPDVRKCVWAHGSTGSNDEIEDKTIVCTTNDGSVVLSSDFFKSRELVKIDAAQVKNAGDVELVNGFFIFTDTEKGENGARLGVSADLRTWQWAQFADGATVVAEHFTVLESSNHSLHVSVAGRDGDRGDGSGVATFYTSSSDGAHFTKSLEDVVRSPNGLIDMEKLEGIDGVLLANIDPGARGRAMSRISYDDGRTWNALRVKDCDGDASTCSLHLHSVSDYAQVGRIFSSPAPGVIAGIGNMGPELGSSDDADLYVSTDSGLSWTRALTGPHIYEFGDQGNILLAARLGDSTNKMYYSLDRGSSWDEFALPDKYESHFVITVPDSTSAKFTVLGTAGDASMSAVHLDFSSVYDRKCEFKDDGSADFEKWYARYSVDGTPSCVMGRKQYFWRKKSDADCLVSDLYHEQFASAEPCACTRADYECDKGFVWNGSSRQCTLTSPLLSQLLDSCKSDDSKVTISTGYRLVPGNECTYENGEQLDGEHEVACNELNAGNTVSSTMFSFPGQISEYIYLKKTGDEPNDETILVRTSREEIFITHDQGSTWDQILTDSKNIGIITNPYFADVAIVLTSQMRIHVTLDRGRTWDKRDIPMAFARSMPVVFHQTNKDWFIFNGYQCDSPFSECEVKSFYSKNAAKSWDQLSGVDSCSWIGGFKETSDESLIFCTTEVREMDSLASRIQLMSSTDFFKSSEVHFESIVGYALEREFLVVAAVDDNKNELNAFVSVDGKTFASARFPANFPVKHTQAYTILESRTNSVFMHITVNDKEGSEYGSLLKSNSNGTDYVVSIDEVNRNEFGYVDFERMQGLEGVIVINSVINPGEANRGSRKQLKSRITFNDGAEWSFLQPPERDIDGNKYDCSDRTIVGCSLNLHGYTERIDYRDTFSSGSAVGLMIGVGNVGPWLTDYKDGNTYLTRDGGVTWKEVRKGAYMWEYGDSGSIIALVNGQDSTNTLLYSLDEGNTWEEYQFYEDLVRVDDIATVPSDTSRKFVLFGRLPTKEGDKSFAIQVDFSTLTDKQCALDTGNPESDDFELWTPSHPNQEDNCLFGHEAQYHRKKPERNCYIGWSPDLDFGKPHMVVRNCTCTRRDFECDFNYVRAPDGTCQLVPGFTPPDHKAVCAENPNVIEWWEPTGYRRVPLSTCEGGKELDKIVSHPCPGHEEDYDRKHRGLHGFWLAVVILLPIGMVAVLAYTVWEHYSKNYGQIRLGEEDSDQPLAVQWAVTALAGVVAFVSVLPGAVRSLVAQARQRFGGPRYTSRSSFSRFSHRYSPVDVEESEILAGDDDDGFDDDELARPIRDED